MPLPPLPDLSGVSAYATASADGVHLQVPRRDFVFQGVLIAVLLPVLWLLVCALAPVGLEVHVPGLVLAGIACAGVGISTALGLGKVAMAGRHSERTRAHVGEGRVVIAGGEVVSFEAIKSLRVGQPNPFVKWVGILAKTDQREVVLFSRVPPARGAELSAIAKWLGEAIGVPVDVAVAGTGLGMRPDKLRAVCFVPFQGIWLLFSIASLLVAKDVRVRTAAKQSLTFYIGTGVLLVVVAAPLGIGAAVAGEGTLQVVFLVGLIAVLGFGSLLRIGLGCAAAVQAYRGREWALPGTGWLAAPGPEPAVDGPWKPPTR